jgi:hypothetical protein
MLSLDPGCKRGRRGTLPLLVMNQRLQWLQPLGLLAAIVLVGYAGYMVLVDPKADEVVEDAIADGRATGGEAEQDALERSRDHRRNKARRLAFSPEGPTRRTADDGPRVRGVDPAGVGAGYYGSGEVDPSNAREGFSYAMARVDEIAASRRRLTQEEWDALYREANDAFAALSTMIDGKDESQLAELERAHKRLREGLAKVRVEGRKLAD